MLEGCRPRDGEFTPRESEQVSERGVACEPLLYRQGSLAGRGGIDSSVERRKHMCRGSEEGQGMEGSDHEKQSVDRCAGGGGGARSVAGHAVAAGSGRTLCHVTGVSRKLLGKGINCFFHWLCKYRTWEAHSGDSFNCLCSFFFFFLRPSQYTD